MDTMKKFLKYALFVLAFFIFSDIMIYLNIETTYQNIGRKDNVTQVSIYQAQATKVNGRIKGNIYNNSENKINSTYLRVDLYSERNNLLGSKYIDISNLREDETRNFEIYFKVQDVEYYEIKFTNEKEEGELPEMWQDPTRGEIILGTIITFLIFW